MTQHSNNNGLIQAISQHSAADTAQRLEKAIQAKGMHIFATIDHAAAAQKISAQLRPTVLILFGNPQAGTPLMQAQQTIGLDLPQKMLVSEDETGQVWVSYNDPNYLTQRHAINTEQQNIQELNDKVTQALNSIATQATQAD